MSMDYARFKDLVGDLKIVNYENLNAEELASLKDAVDYAVDAIKGLEEEPEVYQVERLLGYYGETMLETTGSFSEVMEYLRKRGYRRCYEGSSQKYRNMSLEEVIVTRGG